MKKDAKKILVADDNRELCSILKEILEREGYQVDCVYEGFSLISYLKEVQDVDAIILDLMMPEKGGLSVINTVRSVSPASRIIIYTGNSHDYSSRVNALIAIADRIIEGIRG